LSGIENLYGSEHDDTLTGDEFDNNLEGRDGDDELFGGAGDDTLWGNDGNDIFGFSDSSSADTVEDFTVQDSGSAVDVLRFEEGDLGFSAQGGSEYRASGDDVVSPTDPTSYKVIGITDAQAYNDWSDVADVINNAIDASAGDGTNDAGYFVLNNGSGSEDGSARVYYWEGDNDLDNNTVDDAELTHLASLSNISLTDISDMTADNFDVSAGAA